MEHMELMIKHLLYKFYLPSGMLPGIMVYL
jgi:hypothetical protein